MTALTNSTNGAAPVNPSTAPVLDLDQFRLPQDFADIIGVAKILGLSIPPSVLLRADQVIE